MWRELTTLLCLTRGQYYKLSDHLNSVLAWDPLFVHTRSGGHEFLRPQGFFYKPQVLTTEKQGFIDRVRATLQKCIDEEWSSELQCYSDLFNSDYFWS